MSLVEQHFGDHSSDVIAAGQAMAAADSSTSLSWQLPEVLDDKLDAAVESGDITGMVAAVASMSVRRHMQNSSNIELGVLFGNNSVRSRFLEGVLQEDIERARNNLARHDGHANDKLVVVGSRDDSKAIAKVFHNTEPAVIVGKRHAAVVYKGGKTVAYDRVQAERDDMVAIPKPVIFGDEHAFVIDEHPSVNSFNHITLPEVSVANGNYSHVFVDPLDVDSIIFDVDNSSLLQFVARTAAVHAGDRLLASQFPMLEGGKQIEAETMSEIKSALVDWAVNGEEAKLRFKDITSYELGIAMTACGSALETGSQSASVLRTTAVDTTTATVESSADRARIASRMDSMIQTIEGSTPDIGGIEVRKVTPQYN